ncbi:predicted protein [Sclerotinia sclerotiorum 1980 UF-70]|uniref:Uncharacterized protein n=1 Tax=Sclerotinia sclerotiorum (strain ATCC 18683 / 1980 / Ss-1) TaxID=665079 RepID=A7EEF4_SCLS1|nr:predicted protein [Sclerotinia sclerotiorum 1980 UF-70]EDO01220.1 predicted protein [Sclerotinia sclerotiorum 1980 UF-70]
MLRVAVAKARHQDGVEFQGQLPEKNLKSYISKVGDALQNLHSGNTLSHANLSMDISLDSVQVLDKVREKLEVLL